MAEFVGQHAGEFVRRPGLVDEVRQHDDPPTGQGQGIGDGVPANADRRIDRQAAIRRHPLDQAVEDGPRRGIAADRRVAENLADLPVHRPAEPRFDRCRDDGRQTHRDGRDAVDRQTDHRDPGRDRPQDEAQATARGGGVGSVQVRTAILQRGSQGLVGELDPLGTSRRADPHERGGRVAGRELGECPGEA